MAVFPAAVRRLTLRDVHVGLSYPQFLRRQETMAITKLKPATEKFSTAVKKTPKEELAEKLAAKKGKPAKADKPAPAKKNEKDGDRFGLTTGKKMSQVFIDMLVANEKKHQTDEQMIEFLLKEFPNRANKNILHNMREIRWRYNFGKLTVGEDGEPVAPELQSRKFDENGKEIVRVAGSGGLTEAEKAERLAARREKEVEKRAEHDAKIAKLEARKIELEEAEVTRRAEWEEKNGAFEVVEEAPKKKTLKKKVA